MRQDVQEILDDAKVTVELKGYKEWLASDGYDMRGSFYVNGKKALAFDKRGDGSGECDMDILNEKNAKPLLDLVPELEKLRAYPESETLSDIAYKLENMFYSLAEEWLEEQDRKKEFKRMQTQAKKYTLFRTPQTEEGVYRYIKHPLCLDVLKHIAKLADEEASQTVEVWNMKEAWTSYTPNELREFDLKEYFLNKEKK